MGVSEKLHSMDSGAVDAEKWVISAGIALRSSLKPVFTKPAERPDADEDFPTTPTYAESRIPARLPCPPAPKKRKPAPAPRSSCRAREFFNPPDLETIFIRRVEGS
ncbi:cyclin-dependent protein kinase inhibitor SMR6-like [Salvia miltiorrhiza]|uniref:cyclin-dependent protein kinase inhibitor SMR6-like n=1 Tax=Salvia miltiorrhiza TaxID=226208 RepID=UPI0025AD07A0|nr:cyclin-dependent protein kinase inhibitor SMR6-like [Salvia miltiorrhiza]